MALLIFIVFGLPYLNVVIDYEPSVILALVLICSVFKADNLRSGINTVGVGQVEAAFSLGLSPFKTTIIIVLPQALRSVVQPMTSLFIGVLLSTALAVWDFQRAGQLDARLWKFFGWVTTWTFLLSGLGGTLASAAMAALIALVGGLVFLAGRLSKFGPIRWVSVALIEFLRGVPGLLLIYFCFLVLPPLGVKMNSYWMVTLPIGLSTAAVVAEVYRAGVLAVPRGQSEAATSLAMNSRQVFFLVVFPQAVRYVLPSLMAQLVIVVKDTTFGYVVTYGELMQNAKVLIANYDSLIPVYLTVAVIYCLINFAISKASRAMGTRRAVGARLEGPESSGKKSKKV